MPENSVEINISNNDFKALLASKDNDINRLNNEIADLKSQLLLMKEEISYYRDKLFGKKSEKVEKQLNEQLSLFNEVEDILAHTNEEEQYTVKGYKRNKKKFDGQLEQKLKNLEHKEVLLTINKEDLICDNCGGQLVEAGKRFVRHDLVFVPAKVYVNDIYEMVYECRKCRDKNDKHVMVSAPASEPVIPHSYASPSSIAHVIRQKYEMSMPLYRLEQDFKAVGVDLSRTTMANWVMYTSEHYLKLIVSRMKEELLKDSYIHADETTVQVLKEPGKRAESKSYMWVYANIKERDNKIRIFEYHPDRKHENASEFFKGFKGKIISDAYEAYDNIEGTENCLCWAHARRKFADAIKANTDPNGVSLCNEALKIIGELFEVERKVEDLTVEERLKARKERSKDIVDRFFSWCEINENKVLPKSKTGKAIQYALNNKKGLCKFLEDGLIPLTNSLDERTIRNFTIGRKNWLFCNSVKGAEASATCYSLVQSAKANGLDVYKYLEYLFEVMPSDDFINNPNDIDEFLPWDDYIKEICKGRK